MRIRTLIVDDEAPARRKLRELLGREADFEVVAEAADGVEAVEAIRANDPDVVFLDIQMPRLDGFGVVQEVGVEAMPLVVFVTAYDEHALKAFEVNAVDYLLKPYDDLRFFAALDRAKRELRRRGVEEVNAQLSRLLSYFQDGAPRAEAKTDPNDRILIKSSGEIFFLKAEEIDWIEAAGNYAVFHVGKQNHMVRETMSSLEAQLPHDRFMRVSRSAILNLHRVKELYTSPVGNHAAILADTQRVPITRSIREVAERLSLV